MEGRRRNNHRRSQNRKPPRGSWQPTVPAWEKEFCKVVGSMDWDTLLQMKKFTHLYDNVINWNDSAAEEAFSNAKTRYWAEKNSLSCDISLPDPDLYIDKIKWDSDIDSEPLSEIKSRPTSPKTEEDQDHNNHDPVVIFGDFAVPNQDFAPTGWGDDDDDENFIVPLTHSSANNVEPWAHSSSEWAAPAWPAYSNEGWRGYPGDSWQYDGGSGHGYMPWEGDWSNWNWNYANNYNYVAPDFRDWHDDGNVPTASGRVSAVRTNEQGRKHSSSIVVGQTWDQE